MMNKTRILSLLLALVMVLGMLPVSAFAADSADPIATDPVVTITHISLDPAKDALGFKAKVEGDVTAVTEIGFCFRVNGGAEKVFTLTKTPQDGIFTARVKNILAAGGGEATLEAYAFVRMGDVTVQSQLQSTTMKQTLQTVDAAWYTAGYTQTQKDAVKAFCNKFKAQVELWNLENIFGGFFGNAGQFVSSSVIDLSTDSGEAPYLVLDAHKGTPLYTYIRNLQTQNFSFEATVQVNSIIENEYYPKFGMLVNGKTEMVKFYLDMNPQLQVSQVGAVHQNTGKGDDWAYAATNTLHLNMQAETVKLKLVREGVNYYFYVNGALVLTGSDLTDELGAVGFFSFGTELTLTEYTVEADNAVYQDILTQAQADAAAFAQTRNQILQESSSYTVEALELGAKLWNGRGFVFTELPEELLGQSYIYGAFNTRIDMTVLQSGYLYVLTPPTNHANFPDNILAEGSGFTRVNIASDWCLANYSNPINTLVYERKVTPGETISIDASWAIVVVSAQRINMYDLLNPNDGNTLKELAIGEKVWSDEDKAYTFISMPEQLLGKQYVYGSINGGVDVTIGCNGYVYVITHPRTDSNFAKDVDKYGFVRLELPAWTFADYSVKRDTWVYELKVSSGERIQLAPWWGVLIGSETKLDLTDNGVTVPNSQLAVIESDTYASVPVELKQQVFSDQTPYYYHTIPYWLAGKNFLCAPLNGGSATVTKAGKLYLIGRNKENSKQYLDRGFAHVMDLDFEPWGGAGLGGGNFAAMGFALYEKDVTVGETVTWGRWGVPLFYSDKKLPAEPITGLQSLSVSQMPTKTTYKLGETFDATGLVVTGIDRNGNKIVIDSEHYLLAPEVLSADVPAVSVIVNDKICVIPVIVTDENGNDLTDYTPADMSGFTTQKAPIITGSISLGTVDEIVATIRKEEADGATGFIVYLTTLAQSERTVEKLKRIADCTDYPVMALAYGNYDNLEMRLNLWRMAVQAGFDAVDIPADTFSVSDAASKASYAGTVFESAAPKEVSMDADVIAQQKTFMAELRQMNPDLEILMSAHVGVAMNQEQGVALAKEMENRGADIAKIVLASTSDLEEALQTNMVLQQELSVPFFYNCAGAASRPYRTAAGLMGTQVVFCCAPYHEMNAYVYDYARDLREFYNTIPELYLPFPEQPAVDQEGVSLTTNHFVLIDEGKYSLSTNGYTDAMMDNVAVDGEVVRAASYRVKGTLSLTKAETWGQARILATADDNNGYVIALEKVGENAYQVFTMSRLNESLWNDWRLISHFEVNGDRNSIDFELVVNGGKITFLLDDQICYENSRVAMTQSTPGFGTSNVATTTVSALEAQVFADSAEAESYLATKSQADYVSRFQTRMDSLYNEYITQNGCAGKGGTLIFGDSYMDFWSTWESQTGLTKYVDGYNVGIGGSATKDWLLAYEQLVKPFAAERMIINLGYNDVNVWGDNGEDFVKNLQTLFETIHADFPETEIYYIYINPSPSVYANGAYTNGKVEDAINRSKALIAGLDYVTGVDIFDLMTTEDGKNPVAAYYVSDNIHLSTAGYEVLSAHLYELIFKQEPTGFFGHAGNYQSSNGIDYSKDQGDDPSVRVFGGAPQYTYVNGVITDKFCFETQINVQEVLNADAWPKFGLMVNGASEMVKFYVDMTPTMTATHVGVVYQPTGMGDDWAGAVAKAVSDMAFTGSDTIKLKLIRDGRAYFFYVNDELVLFDGEGFCSETGTLGLFSFNTEFTASGYSILVGDDANDAISAAFRCVNFFESEDVDLSTDCGANAGTVNVNTGKSEYISVKDFSQKDFYFETKVHVNEIYNNDGSAKFGIFAEGENTRELFYVDMATDKTATKVGVVTATKDNDAWLENWDAATTEKVEGMQFAGNGEYVTLGLKKEDGRFFLYVNGKFALYLDSAITGEANVGVFGINTGMQLKEYFANKKEGIDSLLTLTTEGQIGTVELGGVIWSDKTYKFKEMPAEFIGESYIKNVMKSDITFTAKKDGYIYVLTPYRGHGNSIADELELDLYDRIETPAWYLATYTNPVKYWAYERQVKAGETVTIQGGSNWHMVVVSELPVDPTLHQISNYVFSDNQLAEMVPTDASGGTLATVANGVYPFADRGADASNPAKLQNLPEGLIGKSLIVDNLNDPVQATVTKAGKVFLIASTSETRKTYFTNSEQGYTFVTDLKAEYGNTLSASSYNANGYGLYVKDVEVGDFERTRKSYWSITIFGSDEKLPAEPPVSIAVTQMPTKTTYKLGESFDPTGMVVMGTDKYGNVAQLNADQYVTVPSTFTANAYAAAVIVDDLIVAIPVTITDADGNQLTDDTTNDTSKYSTQKAPLLNGSVKRSTVDEVIAAIAKMEADGATAFNVHLTSLNTEYRNYESFKKIADCTDYPVMAIAYGNESNREYRINLMKEAVRAGFDIVDIPMNTFDDDSRASLAGTVFETANPNEVSMDATVIEQQKALIQEFKDLGAEVLVSAHIGVSLTEAEGVALGKEMEARGADVAKIVLGSGANSMQDVVMQTNQTLQNELNIKFYYNASGNASRPYRTASCLLGSHMIFCYAEYHSTNLETYDYIKDLKAFYDTIPALKAKETMLKTNNGQKIDTVAIGKTIWTTRDYVFTSMPEAFIGKEFVKASYGVSGQTVDVTVQKPGYIYVITNAYKTTNSQAEILDEMNYTKLDMAAWEFCDFSGNTSYIWVYEKYVEPGETLQLGQWSVVIASEEKLNLDADSNKTADADMAVLQPLDAGASVGNMESGATAFANRTYTISDMPYWLAGKNYILGNYGAGSATVTRGGVIYMITNTGNSGKRVTYFEDAGYEKVNVPAFALIASGDFTKYEDVVFKKTVTEGETVSWSSWAIPVFSGDLVLSDNLAKIAPDGTTTQAARYDQNVRLFDNRTYYASGDRLEALHGKSYLYSSFDEGATGTVTTAGTVYVQIPVKTTSTYEQLETDLLAAGYTPVAYRLYRNNKGVPGKSLGYCQKLYQKEVAVGDVIHFGCYNLVYFDTLSAEQYYEMPSVTTGAKIFNDPEITGIQDALYTYAPAERNWQGCPVVTITAGPNGNRMWAAWFTGGETELATGNFAVLLYSDDEGQTWVDSAVAIVHPDVAAQVTKPQLWTMADGRLWVSWSQHTGTGGFDGKMGTWAAICENPGAPLSEMKWSEPVRLFDGRGNGKITVLNKGTANEEWLTTAFDWIDRNYSKVYSSTDQGATWTFKGKAEVTGSTYNNAIIVERKDANNNSYLWMVIRQLEGNMKESFSYDGGATWTNAQVSHIAHPNSAIYMGYTSSGKLLMINHKDFNGRNNLTAFLSEDGGKTWAYTLLLDERLGVSYPDVIEDNGTFYVVYDYDRFNTGRMFMAKITEADIMAGQLVTEGSYLKHCFASMGITGAQVGENAQLLDLSDKVATASTQGSPASHAFDKNTDTRWCATNEAVPQWLTIDLKDVYNLEAVYMFFEQKSDWNYKVETSVDGSEWSVYSDPEAQALVDVTINQQAQARYVRLTVESTTGGAWASVWEMEVYVNANDPMVVNAQ